MNENKFNDLFVSLFEVENILDNMERERDTYKKYKMREEASERIKSVCNRLKREKIIDSIKQDQLIKVSFLSKLSQINKEVFKEV